MTGFRVRWTAALVTLTVLCLTHPASADVKLPSVFGSGMVLQRDMPVPVWGWAEPNEAVKVSFRDQTVSTTADAQGNWQVKLAPLSLGAPGTLTVSGKNTATFTDVLVGEVWVCSGQSNMGLSVDRAVDADLERATAKHPNIRLFQVPLVTATEPQKDVKAQWVPCTPENIGRFTAVGYFFGRELHDVLDVPVGLIQTAWGGTRAEAWTSPEAMAKTQELQPILDAWKDYLADPKYAEAIKNYPAQVKKWEERAQAARAAGKPVPARPRPSEITPESRHRPSNLYNAMVSPIVGFAIRGAVWYQGESNAGRAYQYRTLMPVLIQSWRDAWKQGDFPFYQVQLANFKAVKSEPGDSDWAELREAQYQTKQVLPNADSACITDLGAALDIHPRDKQNVGKRLARLALNDIYKVSGIIRQGPTFQGVQFNGNKAVIKFDTHGSNLTSYYGEPLQGFALAGEDKKWVWGDARITAGDTVTVTAPGLQHPVAVRYNWADNPQGNLYNEILLPAYPFRSDDWEPVTKNNVRP